MQRLTTLTRIPQSHLLIRRTLTTTPSLSSSKASTDTGRPASEHVTNANHNYNIHAEASNKGKAARAEDQGGDDQGDGTVDATQKNSAATSERTTPAAKEEEAKSGRKDKGMGLQDERGGVCV